MRMYNLLEFSDNHCTTSGSLWNYYSNETNDLANDNNNANNYRMSNKNTTKSKSFEYKAKIIERTPNDSNILDAGVTVPLKYLSNF